MATAQVEACGLDCTVQPKTDALAMNRTNHRGINRTNHTSDIIGGCTSAKEDRLMKAIRVGEFGGPETLKIAEVPDPKPDSDGSCCFW